MKKLFWVILSISATVAAVWLTPWAALPRTLLSLTGIVAGVCAICVVAGVLEYRCWLHRIAKLARPLMRFSRLPGECALAFVASFASGNVAALMLAEKRNEGKITRREMILGALCNSIPPLFMTGRPVLGVIDFQRDLGLPEEDSVGFAFTRPVEKEAQTLDVAIIHLGHIANFTDYSPLEAEPDVTIRKVATAAEFGTPDIVILPGSKSVAADLARLRESGLADQIYEAARRGATVAGICGGLQLLGERLLDPDHVESDVPEVRCLGLLPLETVMRKTKTLRRTQGFRADGTPLSGYEIHHGETVALTDNLALMRDAEGRHLGYERDNLFATYLHGVFDDDRFRRLWLDEARRRKGWSPKGGVTAVYGIEDALNRLAAHVRSRVDLKRLYKEMGVR